MADPEPRISEDDARALWRRAAELQAAAERGRLPARKDAAGSSQDLTLEQVAAAAEGAGIDPDYVRVALAEQRLPDGHEVRRDRWTARWLRRIVGEEDAIEVARTIAEPGERVLAAFQKVAQNAPYGAELRIRAPLFRRGINLGRGRDECGVARSRWRLDGRDAGRCAGCRVVDDTPRAGHCGRGGGWRSGPGRVPATVPWTRPKRELALHTLVAAVALETENEPRVFPSRSPP